MNPTEQMQALQKAELESAVSMTEKMLSGFEQMTKLNLQVLRESTQDATDALRATLSARDLQDLMNTQAEHPLQGGGEKSMAYVQRLAEIVAGMQAEMAEAMNQNLARLQQAMREAVDTGGDKLPAGSEPAQAFLQSALNFTTQAFEAMQKTQGQAAKIVADQVQQLTSAAGKPQGRTSPARKRST